MINYLLGVATPFVIAGIVFGGDILFTRLIVSKEAWFDVPNFLRTCEKTAHCFKIYHLFGSVFATRHPFQIVRTTRKLTNEEMKKFKSFYIPIDKSKEK